MVLKVLKVQKTFFFDDNLVILIRILITMKKFFTSGIAFFLIAGESLFSQTCTAVPVITLTGAPGTQVFVAYNSLKNVYHTVGGGSVTNMPVTTYSYTGGMPVANVTANNDFRGLWWNSNTGIIEGNGYNGTGIFSITVNGGNGYAIGGGAIITGNQQPDIQSCGSFNNALNQVIYYFNGSIYKYSRVTGFLIASVAITGLPVGLGNISTFNGFYTGIPGSEYAVYDHINKRAYNINYTSGAYVSTVQFPASAPAPASYGLSYANNLFFLNDGAGKWFGHAAGIYADCAPNTICQGSSATLNAISASNYTWSTGAVTPSINVSPSVTTSYSVASTATVGCPSTMAITVNVIPAPVISISGSTVICVTGTNVLTATGANSYTWNTGVNSASISDSPTVTTNYTVAGTNTVGCINTKTVTITVSGNPTISINGSLTICNGQSATLTASGANTYSWSNGALTAMVALNPTINTTYTVIGTNTAGCSDANSQTITVIASPTVSIASSTNVICPGGTIILTANGADTYSWNMGAATNTIACTPTVNTTYTVAGTSTTSGCSNTAVQTVTVFPPPIISITGGGIYCEGQTVTLTAAGANTYSWDSGANTTSIISSPTFNTTYTVTGTSPAGCVSSATTNIIVTTCTGLTPLVLKQSISSGIEGFEARLYPNPTTGEFTIELNSFSENTKTEVYDYTGQLILNSNINFNQTKLNLNGFATGLYLVKIIERTKILGIFKVVKE